MNNVLFTLYVTTNVVNKFYDFYKMFVFQSRQDSTNLKEELEKSRGSAEVGQACN